MDNQVLDCPVEEALDAFWEVIVEKFPQATTGDLSPLAYHQLQMAAENAVKEWVNCNAAPKRFDVIIG